MIRTLSIDDPTLRWDSLIDQINEQGDEVIIEDSEKRNVVVISMAAYEETQMLRERARQAELLERLRALEERIGDRNADLSEEQVMELANRFSREMIDDLAAEGKLVFERDLR
ncbi:MAG: hypothetical protein H0U40_12725 [Chloroflexia bacterium]|nr:hypothetical protein [Chloroflexia bacterium]